ncbi:MAG: hypothetical protein HUJ42_00130 [Malacoplasma sp.]|nr:hypothetical protein [Malacoplasma sp.]
MKTNVNVNQNFFYEYVGNDARYEKKKLSKWSKSIIYFIFAFVIIGSFIIVGFSIAPRGFTIFSNHISQIFVFSNQINNYPNQSLILLSLKYLWISIQGVLIGTSIGFAAGFISATIANKHFFKISFLNWILKGLLAVLRAFVPILFIYFFTTYFSKNIALILLLAWYTWIWVHKYMIEIYQNLNYHPYNYLLLQGSSKINAYLKTILFQVNNKFIALFLYSFDSNMRWSSILGVLGLAGIGELIENASDSQYQSMGIPLVTIIGFMLILETFVYLMNRYVLVHKSFLFNKSVEKFISYKRYKTYFKLGLLVFFVALFLYASISLDWTQYFASNSNFLQQIFNPNWNVLNDVSNFDVVQEVITLIAQTFVIMFLTLVSSIFFIFISCYKLFKYYSLLGIFLSTMIRAIPTIALFFIFNPIFINPSSSICIIFAFSTATVINKNITESINKLSSDVINIYKMQGYSKLTIFFKYILGSIKKDFLSLFFFQWESQFRDLITYGQYGVSIIGAKMYAYFGLKKQTENMAVFMWIAFFLILLVIFIEYNLRIFVIENKNIFQIVKNTKTKTKNWLNFKN